MLVVPMLKCGVGTRLGMKGKGSAWTKSKRFIMFIFYVHLGSLTHALSNVFVCMC